VPSNFVNFGPGTGDLTLFRNDNNCYLQRFTQNYLFFGRTYPSWIFCTNGFVYLQSGSRLSRISPYESNLNTNVTGNIYYRNITDAATLRTLSTQTNNASFSASSAFVMTWDRVPTNANNSSRNSFQLVLAANAQNLLYIIINYGQLDVAPPLTRVVDAFNANNTIVFQGNSANSNVNVPGRFVLKAF
jgi:hypothetical protein